MPTKTFTRPIAAAAVLACAAATLAACGSSKDDASGKTYSGVCDTVKSGSVSESVKTSGDIGQPAATFDKPLKATGLERTIVKVGSGEKTEKGQNVNVAISVYLGTGKELGKAQTGTLPVGVSSSSLPKAFAAGAACLPVGSRAVVTDTAKDVYGSSLTGNSQIKATDSLVIVTDVVSVDKPLVPSKWTKDVPKVSIGKGGKPKVTLTSKTPSKNLELKVLKQGTGATVKSGDSVTLDYQGTSWDTGKIFDQSYGRSPATFTTDQVVKGFGAALVGQKVGTQLIVTMPPEDAYGAKGSGQQLSGQTLVFYIDIEKTKSAS
ncbi:MAG TPA: FKBP-type peptidyl-prolyl cis-trans isomerase [Marmoricola sp.]